MTTTTFGPSFIHFLGWFFAVFMCLDVDKEFQKAICWQNFFMLKCKNMQIGEIAKSGQSEISDLKNNENMYS